MDIVNRVSGLVSHGAGWVLWLLIGLSCVALAIMIERAVYLWSARDNYRRLSEELRNLLRNGDTKRARLRLQESPSFEARIAEAGLKAETPAGAEEYMASETELVRLRLEKHLAFLGTLGNNAPFIGLLGTVIGVIRAFRELSSATGQLSAGLLSEIGEALIATAIGLVVALPAVLAFNLFQRSIKTRLTRGSALGRLVLGHLKGGERAELVAGAAE